MSNKSSHFADQVKAELERVKDLNPLDVLHNEKQLEKMFKTPEGREAFRRITGLRDAKFVGEADGPKEKLPIVALLMPSYKRPAPQCWQALQNMIAASHGKCQLYMEPTVSQSIVHWTRNYALSLLIKTGKPWDYVAFMDDDMVPPPDALVKLLSHKKDVVAAACTVRVDPPVPNFRVYDPDEQVFFTCMDWERDGLIGGEHFGVGTGMILYSRNVIERVGEYYINCKYEQKYYGLSGDALDKLQTKRQAEARKTNDFWWFEFLKQPKGLGEFGEDVSFCFKCIELGIPIYVDTTVNPGHVGDYAYSLADFYDYRDVLKEREQRSAEGTHQAQMREAKYSAKISILVPTRGRPENVKRLLDSLKATSFRMPEVVLYVDDDDESYSFLYEDDVPNVKIVRGPRIKLSECWNKCAAAASGEILMHGGDDIVFKTNGWDEMVAKCFEAHSDKLLFVHGNDGHWKEKFGTHGFLHRKWIEAVGYFVPPYFSSDFNDTWLNEVANELARRIYLPFLTEHMHPLWGKADWDQTHKERLARHDRDKVEELYKSLASRRAEDVLKLKAAIEKSKAKECVA